MVAMRTCVFCNQTNLSKEHIFAQWLLKELEIYNADVMMTHANSMGIPKSNRKHPFSKLVNGLVCEKCNNGWMSQLEGDCQKHIINLMNMENIKDEVKFLKENYDVIAKWAFKNVILLNSATNYSKIIPEDHYTILYTGSIPKGVFIDLAFCRSDSKIEWRQSSGGLVIKDKAISTNSNIKRYTITFQIKSLLIKVVFYESSANIWYEDEGAIRLYPQPGIYGTPNLFDNIDDFDLHGVIHEYLNIKK